MDAKRLGDILLEAGLISGEQLRAALALQDGSGKHLGEVLLDQGCVSEELVVRVLEFQLGTPRASWSRVDPAAVSLVSRAAAEKHLVFPLLLKGDRLLVAMADPLDYLALQEIQGLTGLRTEVCLATRSEIAGAIARWYGRDEAQGVDSRSPIDGEGNCDRS